MPRDEEAWGGQASVIRMNEPYRSTIPGGRSPGFRPSQVPVKPEPGPGSQQKCVRAIDCCFDAARPAVVSS
jgi:hypothetical protein